MTLLDRLRTSASDRHADPAMRLAHVAGIPLSEREAIARIAREDEDARVRRAAVLKLMDPPALGAIAQNDPDQSVRAAAAQMLRDIALEAYEGLQETDSLDAVDAIGDSRALAGIAKAATRDIVAVRALSRIGDAHMLGSIARHAATESARMGALESLRERGEHAEILAVALNGEFKDASVAAVDLIDDRAELDQVANRARHRSAAKRARAIIREAEGVAVIAEESAEETSSPVNEVAAPVEAAVEDAPGAVGAEAGPGEADVSRPAEAEAEQARLQAEAEAGAQAAAADLQAAAEQERNERLSAILERAIAAAGEPELAAARKAFGSAAREWRHLASQAPIDPSSSEKFNEAEARMAARETEAAEADARARRESLARLRQLLAHAEPLVAKPEASLKSIDRVLRDVKGVLAAFPPLPTTHDTEEITTRLKAVQATLTPRAQEMREAVEWQRWANANVQEQLCARMEALAALEDPAAIAAEIHKLQQQWREVADVPRARADALWRRFQAAHDVVWPRCQAHFAAEAEARAANLARKIALCEKAEALADSSNWIQTAEEIKQLQAEWKTIGPVSRGREKAIWERFRKACDQFFTRRHADLAARKKMWAENFAKKEALCVRAEELAQSTDWEQAAASIRSLQAEWKAIGPVKKTRSEAIWQRFRKACDEFFARYARRHETARLERTAAREALCVELESLAAGDDQTNADVLAKVRAIRASWQREVAGRGVDSDVARALDRRFSAALAAVQARWPDAFAGTDLDSQANRKRMESLVTRMEELARSVTGETQAGDGASSPTERLAAMLKEALAANTIGGRAEDGKWRAAAEEVRQAKAAWSSLGVVPEDIRRPLQDRFQQACRRITDRLGR